MQQKPIGMMKLPFAALLLLLSATSLWSQSAPAITVAILPLQEMVAELAGSAATVSVMIPPGASPEQFEPTPSQIRTLSQSLCYFSVGAQLERAWMPRIRKQMPQLQIVDLATPVATRLFTNDELPTHGSKKGGHHSHHGHHHSSEEPDPHVWTDPLLLVEMAAMAAEKLQQLFPDRAAEIASRLEGYQQRYRTLHSTISQQLAPLNGAVMLVFHPAWGYFADRYQLRQVAIEQGGRSPTPKMLAATIALAREKKARAIFVQSQMNQSVAEAISQELSIPVVEIDPLSPRPQQALLDATEKIVGHLSSRKQP